MGHEKVHARVTVSWIADCTGQKVETVRRDAQRVDFSDGETLARYIIGAKVCRRGRSKR